MLKLLLFTISLFALAGIWSACQMTRAKPQTRMTANASWDEEGQLLVKLDYAWRSASQEPYYNAQNADDWQIILEESDRNLTEWRTLMSWPNDSHDGGGIIQEAVYWLHAKKRLVYTESQQPTLLDLESRRAVVLRPPGDVILAITGPELAPGVSGDSPIPSPDGRTVAVWFNTSYIDGGPFGPQIHTHFVSFFRTADGRHIHSVKIPFANQELDPRLRHMDPANQSRMRFLWRPDASGIYIVSRKEAFFLGRENNSTPQAIQSVPRWPLPTNCGSINKSLEYLYIHKSKAEPNLTSLQIKRLPATDFTGSNVDVYKSNPLVPLNQINYATP
ncbi:MAG: hypothetical protein KDK39_00680 [Leptospiraceae bacterium]|nr:hypothetical protein [Leptospiraceae bacterium]